MAVSSSGKTETLQIHCDNILFQAGVWFISMRHQNPCAQHKVKSCKDQGRMLGDKSQSLSIFSQALWSSSAWTAEFLNKSKGMAEGRNLPLLLRSATVLAVDFPLVLPLLSWKKKKCALHARSLYSLLLSKQNLRSEASGWSLSPVKTPRALAVCKRPLAGLSEQRWFRGLRSPLWSAVEALGALIATTDVIQAWFPLEVPLC